MAPSDSECWISRDDLKKKKKTVNSVSPYVRESKKVLDSGFHAMDSGFFVTGTFDSGFQSLVGSGFLEMYFGFQRPGFLNLQAKHFPDSLT